MALIFMDYARQLRLKVFGVARIRDVQGPRPYDGDLATPGYRAIVEREIRVEVQAFDWNCPQHITPRYTTEQVSTVVAPLRRRISDLEAEIHQLRELQEGLP